MTNPKYANTHQKLRRALLPSAVGSSCVRCGLVILPGQPIDLDHQDDGVTIEVGPTPHVIGRLVVGVAGKFSWRRRGERC